MLPEMGLDSLTQRWLHQAQDFTRRHHRGIIAFAVTGLAGFAVTAFGIAPLAPDAALLPQHLVTQAVTPESLGGQVDAIAERG
ncbi:MAG: M23 family peptidase, partial [Burkholderiales bacterium]|nr:M23 family peptidase [Burkholderiales bacterium]